MGSPDARTAAAAMIAADSMAKAMEAMDAYIMDGQGRHAKASRHGHIVRALKARGYHLTSKGVVPNG